MTSVNNSVRSSGDRSSSSDTLLQPTNRLLRMSSHDTTSARLKSIQSSSKSEKSMQLQDFNDLFATLVVSLPLTTHRHLFQKIPNSFTSEEAIANLGSLKLSQSNRMLDPTDSSRVYTTTTTTTFSMGKEMARSVCTRFVDAYFIQPAIDSKTTFASKSAIWFLTPKGIAVLRHFCQRHGIFQEHVISLLDANRNSLQLINLEREAGTDKLHTELSVIEVLFRRFAGPSPNVYVPSGLSEGPTMYNNSSAGVRVFPERKLADKTYPYVFSGLEAVQWILGCTSVVDRREALELGTVFLQHSLLRPVPVTSELKSSELLPVKNNYYIITEKGQRIAGWLPTSAGGRENKPKLREGLSSENSAARLTQILADPALRLLFHEFLRDTLCAENLSFYFDCEKFLKKCTDVKTKGVKEGVKSEKLVQAVGDAIATAFHLYNTFLALGSPNELNIDYNLRSELSKLMTLQFTSDSNVPDETGSQYLSDIATLFEQAKTSVFKLMASDSVPKFTSSYQDKMPS